MDQQDYKAMNDKIKNKVTFCKENSETGVNMLIVNFPEIDRSDSYSQLIIEQAKEIYKNDIISAYVSGRIEGKKIKFGIEYYNKLNEYIDEGEEYYNETYEQ